VHQALGSFDNRKKELVKTELDRIQEATNLANASMSSMNLPAALEVTKGNEIPQSLREKSQAVINAGGPDSIKKLIHELPELLTRNTELLDECDRLLREERESDEQLRTQFKEKWTRTSSDKLTGSFNTNAQKYRTIINNAKDADKVVRDKFDSHSEHINLLAQGSNSIEGKMPGASGSSDTSNSPNAAKLKALCESVETLKAERQAIEAEIKGTNPDMKNVFLTTHGQEGAINEEEMSKETLDRAFSGLIHQVNDSIQRQEGILKEMTEVNGKFLGEKGGKDNGNARDDMLKKLAAGHDAFFELQKHLQEGTKFYNDLTQLLVTFQNKVSDYCFARKTEKDELMKDLTAGLSQMDLNQTGASTIAAPAHHTPSATEPPKSPTRPPRAKDTPPRPPPPQVSSQPSTTETPSAPNPYAGAPNPYAGAPPAGVNPYAGAPPGAPPAVGYPPYGGAPPGAPSGQAPLPYPTQPNMPMPYQPYAYPPQGGYPQQQPPAYYPQGQQPPAYGGYGQQPYYPPPPQGGHPPPQGGQPPQYYPPQNPGQQPQWR